MKLPALTLAVITGFISLPAFSDTYGWQQSSGLSPAHHQDPVIWDIQPNRNDDNNREPDSRAIAENFIFAVQWSILWETASSLWANPSDETARPVLLLHYDEHLHYDKHLPDRHQQAALDDEHEIYLGAKILF